jgi:PAS domain S-box-containing protein
MERPEQPGPGKPSVGPMTLIVTVTHPPSDRGFARHVHETLGNADWALDSPAGLALLQSLLRTSYPLASVVAQEQPSLHGNRGPDARVMVFRDGVAAADAESLGWLGATFDQHGAAAYRLALEIVHHRNDAESVVERAFQDLSSQRTVPAGPDRLEAFLGERVRSLAASVLEARTAQEARIWARDLGAGPGGAEAGTADPGREDAGRFAGRFARAQETLAAMPVVQRTALELARSEGLTRGAIAGRLGLDVTQVTALLTAAMYSVRLGVPRPVVHSATDGPRATARSGSPVAAALEAWRLVDRALARLGQDDPAYAKAVGDVERSRSQFHDAVARMQALWADGNRVTPSSLAAASRKQDDAQGRASAVPSGSALTVVRAWVKDEERRTEGDRHQVIVVTDAERRYVAVTTNIQTLLGYQPEEVLGRRVEDLAAPALVEATPTLWDRFVAAAHDAMTFALLAKDGRIVPVRYDATADYPVPGFHTSRLWPLSDSSLSR